ncbi:Bacteriohemerythrin [Pontiella desulfatans]|uniref:Bacteriohemerythrin n=1 Tax=Pontiella desulfatans TaxID=2750659 RepID=A0A6C2U3K8_PONDE|nr:bacteriohemerythrin [Pontiella desulfatans]VGO14608.1 Bacteriohemerythrin [Pontiella desulfatans]
MNEVKWTDDLSVGVGLIDDQHKELIQHLNNLTKAVEEQHGPNEVPDTLSFLIDYTDLHFSMEERNMEAHGYPAFEAHKAKHDEFKAILADMESEFRDDGPTAILAESIDTLLINWLLKHIRVLDVEFGAFLKSNGLALSE